MFRPTILVVEDEQLVALDIESRLVLLGFTVVTAASGEEAVERARSSPPDLVLMDIRLGGGIDGIEAADRIRSTIDVPIVYLTAYADESTLKRAGGSEPYGYVLKPFDARELKATIEMALQRHWLDRRRREQEEQQRFLAESSARLAESLDCNTVIARAEELLVPRHAEACSICLLQNGEPSPSLTLVQTDAFGTKQRSIADRGALLAGVLADGRTRVYPTCAAGELRELLGSEQVAMLAELALSARSLLCVPILARDKTLGAILLVCCREGHPYGTAEVSLAEDFAHRLGLAVDNALLYREARQAIQMREEVLAVVSHDLRNLLGTISMRAQLLSQKRGQADSPQAILRTAKQMTRLMNDLVDAASIDASHLSLDRKPQSVGPLCSEAIDTLRPIADEKSVAVEQSIPPTLPDALCDRDRVLQVLSNLVSNAIKFTPSGGAIDVRARRVNGSIELSIHDTGPGIPSAQVPHLFDRFWRADSHCEGAGLGLYIAKGIVEAHGGRIWAASGPGGGTTFTFTLPAARGARAKAPA
ncbi:MAG: response regulator [Polyangiaceae bacterium]|nr:response regulator [Polyangiaceae bacterium]